MLQLDVHAPAATVDEALLFSGRLRFGPEVDNATVRAFVDEVRTVNPPIKCDIVKDVTSIHEKSCRS